MARIVQLLSVMGTVKDETAARMDALKKVASDKNAGQFDGHEYTYEPLSVDGAALPPESRKVRVTAVEVLNMARTVLSRSWDLARTVDQANTQARADVHLADGSVLLPEVPVTHLLWLARQIEELTALVAGLPERSPTRDWSEDGQDVGIARSEPVRKAQERKTPYNWPRGNGSQHFQEQVDVLFHEEVVGYWTQIAFSGAISPARKRVILDRLSEVAQGIKMAREEANTIAAIDQHEAKTIFDYLLA